MANITVTTEVNEYTIFNELWSGGRDTLEDLTTGEVSTILDYLEELQGCTEEPMSLTDINDFFWFERDYIAELLGYNDYEEIMERNKN